MVSTATVTSDGLDRLELHLGRVVLQLELGQVRVLIVQQPVDGSGDRLWQNAGLQDATAVIAWAVIVKALANDFTSFDYNRTMAVMERRQTGLLDTKIKVRIRLHYCGMMNSRAFR